GDAAFGDIVLGQAARELRSPGQGPFLLVDESVSGGESEGHGLARNDVFEGPPCWPGKTAELIFFAISVSSVRMMPPRGPPRVLCVVEVTTWACGTGEGWRPAATSPAKWAMSTMR